ncbi:MAG: 2-C-methyl-D-erythritol 4-phosphate cytidylyltransferase [Demequinaceae bacterium]|nr:2-C-methyl-D-erythritol 4-phosphate cytidylyltransferase [Demequinaceae bacterium]
MTTAAVIAAAGLGTRLGSDLPKALVAVAGQPLVAWALDRIADVADRVVVTVPPGHESEFDQAVSLVRAGRPRLSVEIVAGGETRRESVAAGLRALLAHEGRQPSIILVHDAARAFMPVEAMQAAIGAIQAGADGAVPVVPLVDTLVASPEDDGSLGAIVDREAVKAAQTPQVFRTEALVDAHAKADEEGVDDATDDAGLVRRYGYRVVATEGHPWGFKVTVEGDLALAEHVARLS